MSKCISLVDDVEILDGNIPQDTGQLKEENFSLLKFHSKMITITPLMRDILERLRTPKTLENVITEISNAKYCSYDNISQTVTSFLDKMMRMGVLTYESTTPKQKS